MILYYTIISEEIKHCAHHFSMQKRKEQPQLLQRPDALPPPLPPEVKISFARFKQFLIDKKIFPSKVIDYYAAELFQLKTTAALEKRLEELGLPGELAAKKALEMEKLTGAITYKQFKSFLSGLDPACFSQAAITRHGPILFRLPSVVAIRDHLVESEDFKFKEEDAEHWAMELGTKLAVPFSSEEMSKIEPDMLHKFDWRLYTNKDAGRAVRREKNKPLSVYFDIKEGETVTANDAKKISTREPEEEIFEGEEPLEDDVEKSEPEPLPASPTHDDNIYTGFSNAPTVELSPNRKPLF